MNENVLLCINCNRCIGYYNIAYMIKEPKCIPEVDHICINTIYPKYMTMSKDWYKALYK